MFFSAITGIIVAGAVALIIVGLFFISQIANMSGGIVSSSSNVNTNAGDVAVGSNNTVTAKNTESQKQEKNISANNPEEKGEEAANQRRAPFLQWSDNESQEAGFIVERSHSYNVPFGLASLKEPSQIDALGVEKPEYSYTVKPYSQEISPPLTPIERKTTSKNPKEQGKKTKQNPEQSLITKNLKEKSWGQLPEEGKPPAPQKEIFRSVASTRYQTVRETTVLSEPQQGASVLHQFSKSGEVVTGEAASKNYVKIRLHDSKKTIGYVLRADVTSVREIKSVDLGKGKISSGITLRSPENYQQVKCVIGGKGEVSRCFNDATGKEILPDGTEKEGVLEKK